MVKYRHPNVGYLLLKQRLQYNFDQKMAIPAMPAYKKNFFRTLGAILLPVPVHNSERRYHYYT